MLDHLPTREWGGRREFADTALSAILRCLDSAHDAAVRLRAFSFLPVRLATPTNRTLLSLAPAPVGAEKTVQAWAAAVPPRAKEGAVVSLCHASQQNLIAELLRSAIASSAPLTDMAPRGGAAETQVLERTLGGTLLETRCSALLCGEHGDQEGGRRSDDEGSKRCG